MTREHPIVWIIGATRSCKTALAHNGVAPLGFKSISTGDYFRQRYGKEDTYSREFVFQISEFAAGCLSAEPSCHLDHLMKHIEEARQPCVIEGERNPIEFAKYYDPKKDMVILLQRLDMDIYDTAIERGIGAIEQNVRWCVSTGIAPAISAFKVTFGDLRIKADHFGVNNGPDNAIIEGSVPPRKIDADDVEDRYPWINILIGLVREQVANYLGDSIRPEGHGMKEICPPQRRL